MDIGKQMKFVREAHHLQQKEVAQRAGLGRSYISKLERGLADPKFSTLVKIANAYKLSVPHLLTYGAEEKYNLDIEAAIDALRTLKYNMVKVNLTINPL